jgi:F-type H+-transporting ATPase subunit c
VKKLFFVASLMMMSFSVFAQDGGMSDRAWLYISAVFGMAIAAYGGTNAQSRAAAVALEGIARNPSAADKLFTPMLLALALMESLVIFTLASIFIVK